MKSKSDLIDELDIVTSDLVKAIGSIEDIRRDIDVMNGFELPSILQVDIMKIELLKDNWSFIKLEHIEEMITKL